MDRVWDVLYLDGYKRSNEIDKVLQFTQKGKYNVLYTYTIHTQSTSLDDMFNALNILVNAYSMEEHTGSRDLRTFGELYLPDFMSL
ncbi:MAG: hypothetical protein H6766_05450 [Candidatus Peribacteria bacterium]|nr:MAG: hypothetical protein H6766_05450 [Candidatus Peribacteria bacterium]